MLVGEWAVWIKMPLEGPFSANLDVFLHIVNVSEM